MPTIDHLLNQTATLKAQSSIDSYGRATLSVGSSINCRFQETNRTKLMPTGETITLDGYIDVKASLSVANDDFVVYQSNNYKVVGIKKHVGRFGAIHHKVLEVIKWQT